MLLKLIQRALTAALHAATEEWALEVGLPRAAVEQARARRLALAAEEEARTDERAARALGVEDDEPGTDGSALAALPTPAAARLTVSSDRPCPASRAEMALMDWVHRQREARVSWAEIARMVTAADQPIGENALRRRYHRWRENNGGTDKDHAPPKER